MDYQHKGFLWQLPKEAEQELWTEYASLMRELHISLGQFETKLTDADMMLSDLLFGDAFFQG